MKRINEGIVFSNDIMWILKGKNALDFDYSKKGLKIPRKEEIEKLRIDFKKDVNNIFDRVTVIDEEEMEEYLYTSLEDVKQYPHCIAG